MSVETVAWAKRQRCGCPHAKAVLLELANWARADGVCEFRRVRDIAAVLELSPRSVQRALFRLEDITPADDDRHKPEGLGLIRRVPRFRRDGGQQANCFQLVGYVYPGDSPSCSSTAKAGGRWHTDRGGGANDVTPYKNLESESKNPPKSPPRPSRKRDISNSAHGHPSDVAMKEPRRRPVLAQACEDDRSAALRTKLRERVSDKIWNERFACAAFLFDAPGLKVVVASAWDRSQIEDKYARTIERCAFSIDPSISWVRVDEEPKHYPGDKTA